MSVRKYWQNITSATVFYFESVRQLPQQSLNLSAVSDFTVSLVQPGARASLPHYYGAFDSSHRTRTAGGAEASLLYYTATSCVSVLKFQTSQKIKNSWIVLAQEATWFFNDYFPRDFFFWLNVESIITSSAQAMHYHLFQFLKAFSGMTTCGKKSQRKEHMNNS